MAIRQLRWVWKSFAAQHTETSWPIASKISFYTIKAPCERQIGTVNWIFNKETLKNDNFVETSCFNKICVNHFKQTKPVGMS